MRRMSAEGRWRPIAAIGSSRWLGMVAEWLSLPLALAPTKVRFRGAPASRSGGWPKSGFGVRRHSPAHRDRLQTVFPRHSGTDTETTAGNNGCGADPRDPLRRMNSVRAVFGDQAERSARIGVHTDEDVRPYELIATARPATACADRTDRMQRPQLYWRIAPANSGSASSRISNTYPPAWAAQAAGDSSGPVSNKPKRMRSTGVAGECALPDHGFIACQGCLDSTLLALEARGGLGCGVRRVRCTSCARCAGHHIGLELRHSARRTLGRAEGALAVEEVLQVGDVHRQGRVCRLHKDRTAVAPAYFEVPR
jgi:hypothetical protein